MATIINQPKAVCPVCQKEGSAYSPPTHDPRYRQQMDRIKGDIEQQEGRDIATIKDDEVHSLWLMKNGGWISRCDNPDCETDSFFVRI